MFPRIVNLPKTYSFFLFGPRATGKSTIIRDSFRDAVYIDLLQAAAEEKYARDPDLLEFEILGLATNAKHIVIDEIQKVPRLLDVVHRLIEKTDKFFILTGSSARKLKTGGANLLAGRAFIKNLHALTEMELGSSFDLQQILKWGSLPKVFSFSQDDDKKLYLQAYASTYLKEEIWAEHLIRKLDPFRKFLELAAQHNGKIVNYATIARLVGADPKTVQTYFSILEDTLVGFYLEPFHTSVRKRIHLAPKFYFFDIGVTRALANILLLEPIPQTSYYGEVFEHFVVLEFLRQEDYRGRDYRFSYLRTKDGVEVDLIVERPGLKPVLIEIKSATQVTEKMTSRLAVIAKDFPGSPLLCLSLDKVAKKYGMIDAVYWRDGLGII